MMSTDAINTNPLPTIELENILVSPADGQVFSKQNADDLWQALVDLKEHKRKLWAFEQELRLAVVALDQAKAEDCRTSRVRGERHRIKLEYPDDLYHQATLKQLWQEFPTLSKTYLRIAELAVNKTEFKKMVKESGPDSFELFKSRLLASKQSNEGRLPTITPEEPQTEGVAE